MNSFISWVGGKKLLRKRILEQFPQEYTRYVEVFGGAGWILFAEERKIDLEVYNDINGDLVNLFRVVKYHPGELQRELRYIQTSREIFFDAIQQKQMQGLTDIQRAARFYVVIKESFGNDLRSFGCRPKNMYGGIEGLAEVSKRLQRVVIERQDFEKILKTYDREGTLFYLDPPYYDAEKYYPDTFRPEDHTRLMEALKKIRGKFVLSYNDVEEIRDLYSCYTLISVDRQDNLAAKVETRRYKELIIKNY